MKVREVEMRGVGLRLKGYRCKAAPLSCAGLLRDGGEATRQEKGVCAAAGNAR